MERKRVSLVYNPCSEVLMFPEGLVRSVRSFSLMTVYVILGPPFQKLYMVPIIPEENEKLAG